MSLRIPVPHPALSNPETKLEKAAAKLEKRLAKLRAKDQDTSLPSDWLVPADPEDLRKIQAKWKLPKVYLEFLEKFSPLCVHLSSSKRYSPSLHLYGAADLMEGQLGYSVITDKASEAWPENYLVIGYQEGDPFCIDISDGDDPAVHYSEHGLGYWDFGVFRGSFTAFLSYIGKKGFVDVDDYEDSGVLF